MYYLTKMENSWYTETLFAIGLLLCTSCINGQIGTTGKLLFIVFMYSNYVRVLQSVSSLYND